MWRDSFRVGENLRNPFRDRDLVDTEIWVRRDDSTRREVDTLARKITAESSLFAFQTLAKTANRLLPHLRRDSRKLRIDVHRNGKLKEIPLFLEYA